MLAFREINRFKLPVFLFLTIFFISISTTYGDSNNVTISPDLSTYKFITEQSNVIQTGGIAGVHEIYPIEGYFQLYVDFNAEEASFELVDANLLEPTGFLHTESLNELFNMTELTGIFLDDTTVVFVGKAKDPPDTDTYIVIIVNLTDDTAYIYGQTIPPACCDFFYFDMNAVAKRKYNGGTGEPNNPYKIATAEDLILFGETPEDYDKNFILTADIDLDPNLPGGKVFTNAVIAPDMNDVEDGFQGTSFTGVFDGNYYKISNLIIEGQNHLGLFGELASGAIVLNLGVESVDVNGIGNCIGSLVGENYGTLTKCYSTGIISGDSRIGGLVGDNYSTVTECYSSCTVSVNKNVEGLRIGGLAGWNNSTIINCYSTSTVSGYGFVGGIVGWNYGIVVQCYSTGIVNGDSRVGGLVGNNPSGTVADCYSATTVNGNSRVGGLVGHNLSGTITDCYSNGAVSGEEDVGGLVGLNFPGDVNNCVWDVETSGQSISGGGEGKTTAEMYTRSTFADVGWDFVGETVNGPNDIWKMWDAYDYPRLAYEPGPNTPLVFVDINDPNFYGQMSRYEVTNDQYCDFLNAALTSGDITINDTIVEGAEGSNSGEDYVGESYYKLDGLGWTGAGATSGSATRIHYNEGEFSVDDGFGNHPVTYVSWYGAMAFANYYGYYLPAEDQWQAVADYDGTFIYGCGGTIDPGIANYRDSENPDGTTSVGSYGQYGYGMSDMAGNVWEWTSSGSQSSRVFRGGSWSSYDSDCDVSIWGDGFPYANYYDIGFRVCR